MITNIVVLICLIALLISWIWILYRGWKKKRFAYELKYVVNSLWQGVTFIGGIALGLLITAITVQPVTNFINLQLVNTESPWIWHVVSNVYLLAILYFVVKVVWMGFKPIWKYNEQEIEWNKESKEKFKNRFSKLAKRFSYK